MKRLVTLVLAAGLVFGAATGASAIDFKAKGQWFMSFDYGQNFNFQGKNAAGYKTTGNGNGEDEFEARQRVRLSLEAVASENLSGTVQFEIGDTIWGRNVGGALGADGLIVKVKHAYLDWMVPETDLKIRMGLQGVALPNFTTGSMVMNDDVAGIVASYQFNENVGATLMWLRPFNDNSNWRDRNGNSKSNYMDNMDAVALTIPITLDGVKVTPWGMYAAIGPNTFRAGNDFIGNGAWGAGNFARSGLLPAYGALHKDGSRNGAFKTLNSYGDAWWAGLALDVTAWDPFHLAFDFNYGSVAWQNNGRMNRQGWLASLLLEYKLDWGIPGLVAWYGSGDGSNPSNGSGRMPALSANNTNQFSNFAFDGDPYIARDGAIAHNMAGTWGIGLRLKDMSFVDDLKHTFRINYIGGTNSRSMAKKLSLNGGWANDSVDEVNGILLYPTINFGREAMYLTTGDSALEFGLTNTYKMYDNFTITLEADYIALWLDTSKSAWGARHRDGRSIPETKDAWNINASFCYTF